MKNRIGTRGARGFSLIEVLVAVAILSFGLLGLASLQLSVLRASTDAKSRSVALALAKDKLESLRNYRDLSGYQALTTDATGTTTTVGGISYTTTWTVSRYVFNQDVDGDGTLKEAGDQAFQNTVTLTGATPSSPAGFVANNEFKKIAVLTQWSDSSSTSVQQWVAVEDAVGALAPSDSATISKTGTTAPLRRIPVIITDPALDGMVIPIALGGGVDSAATNPKPQLVIGKGLVETRFDVLTYANISGGTATAQQRVETAMVGCTCGFTTGTAHPKRPTYWDGSRYVVPVDASYTVTTQADPASSALQSTHCDICCRDHLDPDGTSGATYSPRRVTKNSSDVVTAHHPHYFDKNAVSEAVSGTYKEACRIIRIDGTWRVAADLANDYYALLATGNGSDAANHIPDTTSVRAAVGPDPALPGGAVARYQTFVLKYMQNRFTDPTPTASAAKATYNTVGTGSNSPYTIANTALYVLDSPTSVPMNLVATGKWLHSRGLYVDYLEQEATDAITSAKADSACNVDTPTLQSCVLKLLPFTSINLTEIADWGPLAGPPIRVSDNDYGSIAWNTGVAYPVGQIVTNGGVGYQCLIAHTSGTFATDLAASRWQSLAWVTGTSYAVDAVVSNGGTLYTAKVAHTSGTFATDNAAGKWNNISAVPIRGQVTSNASSNGTGTGTTSGRGSNSGLLDLTFDAISAVDNTPLTDTQDFALSGGAAQPTLGNGNVPVIVSYGGTNIVNVSYYTTGAVASKTCNGVASPFQCTVDNGSASTGLDSNGGIAFDVGGYNHQQSVSGQTSPLLTGCTPTDAGVIGTLNSNQATNAPGVAQPYTGSVCKNYAVTGVTTTSPSPGVIDYSSQAPSSQGDGRVFPLPGEVTRITFSGAIASSNAWVAGTAYTAGQIVTNGGTTYTALLSHTSAATFTLDSTGANAGNWSSRSAISITVTLGLTVATPQAFSSCTYTCGQVQGTVCKSNKPTTFTALYPTCP